MVDTKIYGLDPALVEGSGEGPLRDTVPTPYNMSVYSLCLSVCVSLSLSLSLCVSLCISLYISVSVLSTNIVRSR